MSQYPSQGQQYPPDQPPWQGQPTQQPRNAQNGYAEQPQASYPQPGQYQPYSPQSMQSPPIGQPSSQQYEQSLQQQPQQVPPGYPQQPMYQQQPMPMMQQNVFMQAAAPNIMQVNINQKQHGFLTRALYFIFIGWWVGFWWLQIGYLLCLLVVTLPLGLVMLNRLPQVLTLRPNTQQVKVTVAGNVTMVNVGGIQQQNFLIRALYFVFIGSWLGYLWASIGYALCLTVLGIPLGLMMLNRLPLVLTLRRS